MRLLLFAGLLSPMGALVRTTDAQPPNAGGRWQVPPQDQPHRLVAHRSVDDPHRPDRQVDELVLLAPGGASVRVVHATPPAPVLDELRIEVWLKCNQPGAQLAARVRLPRVVDPATGAARAVEVRGDSYTTVGTWQRLELTEIPQRLREQARILRVETASEIDPRQALVDQVVILLPGNDTPTKAWIDQPVMQGRVALSDKDSPDHVGTENDDPAGVVRVGDGAATATLAHQPSAATAPVVEMVGSTLVVGGRRHFPRVIQHNGEPLRLLAELGFNGVLLRALPTPQQHAEAAELGLWLLCPPANAATLARGDSSKAADLKHVIGWYLDEQAAALPPGQVQHWVEQIHRSDQTHERLVILAGPTAGRAQSTLVDVVTLGRPTDGVTPTLAQYADWLAKHAQQLGTATPYWLRMPLTANDQHHAQITHLTGIPAAENRAVCDERLIGQLMRLAVGTGCRGIVVVGTQNLTDTSPAAERRKLALALMNVQLQLIEPWLTHGKVVGHATCSDPDVSAVVWQVERARLAVPMRLQHSAARPGATGAIALTMPGIPEGSDVFALSPAALRPLASRRVAGGVRVAIDASADEMILLSQDPRAVASLRRRIAEQGGTAARLARDWAARRLTAAESVTSASGSESALRPLARRHLTACDQWLARRDAERAYQQAAIALETIDRLLQAEATFGSRSGQFLSLPNRPRLERTPAEAAALEALATAQVGDNMLYGGDFEDLPRLVQFGWRHNSHPVPGVRSYVELTADEPQHGQYCLALAARSEVTATAPTEVTTAPAWVSSPPVAVPAGKAIDISGWVRLDTPVAASADGLEIVDSLGGPDLSLRIRHTAGWQPFRMVRHTLDERHVQLSFVLHGLGEARVDAVMIRRLENTSQRPPAAPNLKRLPATPVAGNPERPLFAHPQLR